MIAADVVQLERFDLPVWRDEAAVAEALGVGVPTLRFFSQHRSAERYWHYAQFDVPKRAGGTRTILAPRRRLKALQRVVLHELVNRLPVSDHAHGFRHGRSIATGAALHVGKKVVISLDLQDFFPSVTFPRVRGYLLAMGYSYIVAATLAALLTEAPRQVVEANGQRCYVPVGPRHCPQGAPTSPGLCNAIALRLDRRLAGLAASMGFTYSRYADDLTFSGDDRARSGQLIRMVRRIVEAEGFHLREDKTRVAVAGRRQRVTGVTVNEVAGLSRKERRRLRAMAHQLRAAAEEGRDLTAQRKLLTGKLAYLTMLNEGQARALREYLGPR